MRTTGMILLAAAALAGCGGGGGNPGQCFGSPQVCGGVSPTPQPGDPDGSPVARYRGSYAGRTAWALVLPDNQLWVLYGRAGDTTLLGGVAQGGYSAGDGVILSTNFVDFSGDTGTIASGSLDGSFEPEVSIAATAALSSGTRSLAGSYDPSSALPATLAEATGSYGGFASVTGGDAAVPGGREAATLAVSSSGVVSGRSDSGCNVSGTLLPNTAAASYNLSVTLSGGICGNQATALRGVAIVDGTRLHAAALNGIRTEAFIFSGGR